jgi:hypothetical protein
LARADANRLRADADLAGDGRRQHYPLAAGIPLAKTERGMEMDFGCCVVRVR